MEHDYKKYPTMNLDHIRLMILKSEILGLFNNMKDKSRDNYYKLCENIYEGIKKGESRT